MKLNTKPTNNTMNTKLKSMFDAIKQAQSEDKEKGGNPAFKEIMKFVPGNTYQVRLVPNQNSPKDTIFHYFLHAWTSNSTGKFVTAMCPSTFGEACPIDTYYLKTYRTGTESEKKAAAVLSRKENWVVNVYVVSDPVNPENEGKVKILRYGKELAKVIQSAIDGDDSDEFGVEKIFDVQNGSTLRIKCENRTGNAKGSKQYVTYASSKFLTAAKLSDVNDTRCQEILDSIHDLKSINKQTTPAEMQRLLDEHFFNISVGSPAEQEDIEPDEPLPSPSTKSSATKASSNKFDPDEDVTSSDTDKELKALLADL